jgi:TATA-box binding protein (TBP) (component of TFIID and TFIIIB)
LFKNGKIICTGAKNEKEVDHAIARAIDILDPYVKGPAKEEPKVKKPVVKKKK